MAFAPQEQASRTSVEASFLEWVDRNDASDADFLAAVDALKWAPWDHRAHLRIAYLSSLSGTREGMSLSVERIRAVCEHGKVTRPGAQFHATMTYAWVSLVQAGLFGPTPEAKRSSFAAFLLLHPALYNGGIWRAYYSAPRMASPAAVSFVVKPDLKPFSVPGKNSWRVRCGEAEGALERRGRRFRVRGGRVRFERDENTAQSETREAAGAGEAAGPEASAVEPTAVATTESA